MNPVKCYLSFYRKWYLHFILWMAPIIEVAIVMLLGMKIPTIKPFIIPYLFACEMPLIDYFGMGGICSKEYAGYDYIKSSRRGVSYMRNVFIVDLFRKLIYYVALSFLFGYRVFDLSFFANWGGCLFIGIIGCIVARYTVATIYAMFETMMVQFVYIGYLFWMINCSMIVMVIGSIVLSVMAMGTIFYLCMRKVRLSYYDK